MTVELKEQPQKKQDKAYDLETFRIMILEDSPFISSLLSSALSEMGIGSVATAADISEGKQKLLSFNAVTSSQNIDVLILDWLMPDGNGVEFINWIRGHKSDTIRFLPIIVCSAYASADLVAESRDAGANEVMVKPVSAEKLAQRILYVIDKPRPYIKAPSFFGPDRRRRMEKFLGEERRKMKTEEVTEEYERLE